MPGREPFLCNVASQPKPDTGERTARVPPILGAYRGVASIDGYLDRVVELAGHPEPPAVPPSASATAALPSPHRQARSGTTSPSITLPPAHARRRTRSSMTSSATTPRWRRKPPYSPQSRPA
jgi:hypothetical protein